MKLKKRNHLERKGVVLSRVGAAEIKLTDDNRIYVSHKGECAFVRAGAQGVIHFDNDKFEANQGIIDEVSRLLRKQRSHRLKHWANKNDPSYYEPHELEFLTIY